MKIFTVHDTKAQAYLPPFYMRTTAEALRAFETTVKQKDTQFNQFPSDFNLCELGEFDETTATFTMLPIPHVLENASKYIQ